MKTLCALLLVTLTACHTAPVNRETPAEDLPMHDEGDRVCVPVNPELIYCQPTAPKPKTIEI